MDSRSGQGHCGREDPLAYGEYHGNYCDPAEVLLEEGDDDEAAEGERGLVGDAYRKIRRRYQPQDQSTTGGSSRPSKGIGSFIFHKLHDAVNDIGSKLDPVVGSGTGSTSHSEAYTDSGYSDGIDSNPQHRYGSFAKQRTGNDAKWYVDGCSYMWAVSRAIEQATTSIWILDCKMPTPCACRRWFSFATRVAIT